jgi:hypothetical protein
MPLLIGDEVSSNSRAVRVFGILNKYSFSTESSPGGLPMGSELLAKTGISSHLLAKMTPETKRLAIPMVRTEASMYRLEFAADAVAAAIVVKVFLRKF